MGGSGSTRRLVVEEIDGAGVVKISESVVQRLRGSEGSSEAPRRPDRSQQGSERSQQGSERSQQSSDPPPRARDTPAFRPPAERVYLPTPPQYGQARIDARKAVQEVELFYQGKLKQLEERNANLQKTTNEQFAKAVQEVEQKFLKQTGSPVCQDLQTKVYQCYLDNSSTVLNCSQEVRAFTFCVERARQNALTRKG